jgi:hypothetical protein
MIDWKMCASLFLIVAISTVTILGLAWFLP